MRIMLRTKKRADINEVQEMLYMIPPKDHKQRLIVACSLKNALGKSGWQFFDDWYRDGSGARYNAAESRAMWKSIDPAGGITFASLIYLAEQYGWQRRSPSRSRRVFK